MKYQWAIYLYNWIHYACTDPQQQTILAMSTIFLALIVVAIIITIVWVLVTVHNRERRKQKLEMLERFTSIVLKKGLSISSQQSLYNSIIGIDGIQRKLLIVRRSADDKYDFRSIDLDQVKHYNVEKCFTTINIGAKEKEKYEKHIGKIILHLEMVDGDPEHLVFFDPVHDHISAMHELEEAAARWESILSGLVAAGVRKTG